MNADFTQPSWVFPYPRQKRARSHACTQLWDVNEEPSADLRGSQSLVVGSDIAPACGDVARALRHLAAALTEGGFLLLREFTGPHALLLRALLDGARPPTCAQQTCLFRPQ